MPPRPSLHALARPRPSAPASSSSRRSLITVRRPARSPPATTDATAFYYSPFECTFQDNTQRVVECSHLRVIGGAQFPKDHEYSAAFIELIEWQLTIDPKKRPTVHQVLSKVRALLKA